MPDVFSASKRSEIMSHIGQKDTKPEVVVRKTLHRMGYRFRLHRKDLPGTPDIVLPRHRKVIFVNGCFWHGHEGCQRAALPKANVNFWEYKIEKNKERDRIALAKLDDLGWECLSVWQCEIRDGTALEHKLGRFLSRGS